MGLTWTSAAISAPSTLPRNFSPQWRVLQTCWCRNRITLATAVSLSFGCGTAQPCFCCALAGFALTSHLACRCCAQFAQRFCADLSQAPQDGIWPARFGRAWFRAGEAGNAMRFEIRATIISLQDSHGVVAAVNKAVSDDDDDVEIVEPAAPPQRGRRLRL